MRGEVAKKRRRRGRAPGNRDKKSAMLPDLLIMCWVIYFPVLLSLNVASSYFLISGFKALFVNDLASHDGHDDGKL